MGGKKQWVYGDPAEAMLRVPDEVKDCVCFLCIESADVATGYKYGGTAFFIGVQSEQFPEIGYFHLVTARHCIEKAHQYGDLLVRINTRDGQYEMIKIRGEWIYSDKPGVDVAVMLVDDMISDRHKIRVLDDELMLTAEKIAQYRLGIGDDLFIAGLFTKKEGRHQNLPIVRIGTIAAMPTEPFIDASGEPYDAYLVEARSIGGLSGSPVFAYMEGRRRIEGGILGGVLGGDEIHILGLVRAHWDHKADASMLDYTGDELQSVNMGIAIVTPIQEVADVLNGEELTKQRRRKDRERLVAEQPTLDSDFGDDTSHAERFLNAVKGLATTPKSEFEKAEAERKAKAE
jgi:hypothetical protein